MGLIADVGSGAVALVQVVDLSRDQLRAAAQLRAATGVKTPDALQLVAALSRGCTTFVTNDRRLPTIPGLKVLQPTPQ